MKFTSHIRRRLLSWAFFASLALHAFVFVAKPLLSRESDTPEAQAPAPIELTEAPPYSPPAPSVADNQPQPPAPKPKKQKEEWEMAESEKAENEKLDPNARILSDKNQTVDEQTRAKIVDDFREKTGTGLKDAKGDNAAEAPPTGDPLKGVTALSDLEVQDTEAAAADKNRGVKRDWRKLSLKDLSVGGDGGLAAASDDHLADLKDGERTILSTREYKYFSYYQRIKELLRQHWKPTVERKLQRLWEKGKPMGEEEVTTRLLVLLSPEGKIQKISRMLSSGVVELDQAAMEAFERAGPFPNPPKGIVDEDGFVRIKWDFILRTETSPRIQFSSAGRGVR